MRINNSYCRLIGSTKSIGLAEYVMNTKSHQISYKKAKTDWLYYGSFLVFLGIRIMKLFSLFNDVPMSVRLFRRDVESTLFLGKPFPFPKFNELKGAALEEFTQKKLAPLHARLLSLNVFESFDVSLNETLDYSKCPTSGFVYSKEPSWRLFEQSTPEKIDPLYCARQGSFRDLLVIAYQISSNNDTELFKKWKSTFLAFCEQNPLGVGIQWYSGTEVSTRLINAVLSFSILSPFLVNEPELVHRFRLFVFEHNYFLENLVFETYATEDLLHLYVAVLVSADFIPNSDYSRRMKKFGENGFKRIVTPDSRDFEAFANVSSTGYYLIAELVLLVHVLGKELGFYLTTAQYEKFEWVVRYLLLSARNDSLMFKTGKIHHSPLFPSSLGLYVFSPVGLLEAVNDLYATVVDSSASQRHFLSVFQIPEFHKPFLDEPVEQRSYALPFGKYFLINETFYSQIKTADLPKHQKGLTPHHDVLSFELYADGESFFVDAGSVPFFTDSVFSNFFTSSLKHNTVTVDYTLVKSKKGEKVTEPLHYSPVVKQFDSTADMDILKAEHYGYIIEQDPIVFRRTFSLSHTAKTFKIVDELVGTSVHKVQSMLLLHPLVEIVEKQDYYLILKKNEVKIRVDFGLEKQFVLTVVDAVCVRDYGQLRNTKQIVLTCTDVLPYKIECEVTVL